MLNGRLEVRTFVIPTVGFESLLTAYITQSFELDQLLEKGESSDLAHC